MNEKEFLAFFAGLLDEKTEELEMDTEFRYLDGWSSLAGLGFLVEMKEIYNKNISVQEFKASETLEDLYNLYKNK